MADRHAETRGDRPEAVADDPARLPPHRLTVERYQRMVDDGRLLRERAGLPLAREACRENDQGTGPLTTSRDRCLRGPHSASCRAGWHVRQEQPMRPRRRRPAGARPHLSSAARPGTTRDASPRPRGCRLDHRGRRFEPLRSTLAKSWRPTPRQAIPIYWIVNIPNRRDRGLSRADWTGEIASYRQCRQYGPGRARSRSSSTGARSAGSPSPTSCRETHRSGGRSGCPNARRHGRLAWTSRGRRYRICYGDRGSS